MNKYNVKERTPDVLNELFISREEKLCAITKEDKRKIKKLVIKNDTYEMLLKKIENLSNDNKKIINVKDSLDSYIDRVNLIGAYENEKFYKIRILWCNKFNYREYRDEQNF